MIERDVVLSGRDESGNPTLDLPVTRLGLIEDGADVKDALADGDYIAVIDGASGGQMKKASWEATFGVVLEAIRNAENAIAEAKGLAQAALTAADNAAASGAGAASAVQGSLNSHIADKSNPHGVTPGQIGAADSGTVNAHIANKSNPHGVTPGQIGAADSGTVNAHIANKSNPHGVTPGQIGAADSGTVNAHIANKSNPHSVTPGQIGAAASDHVHSASQINGLENYITSIVIANNPISLDEVPLGGIVNIAEVENGPTPYYVIHKGKLSTNSRRGPNRTQLEGIWLWRVEVTPFSNTGGNTIQWDWHIDPSPVNLESMIDGALVGAMLDQYMHPNAYSCPGPHDSSDDFQKIPKVHSMASVDLGYTNMAYDFCGRTGKSDYTIQFDYVRSHPQIIMLETGYWTMSFSGKEYQDGSFTEYPYGMTVDGSSPGAVPAHGTGWHGDYMHLPFRPTFALPFGTKLTKAGYLSS